MRSGCRKGCGYAVASSDYLLAFGEREYQKTVNDQVKSAASRRIREVSENVIVKENGAAVF